MPAILFLMLLLQAVWASDCSLSQTPEELFQSSTAKDVRILLQDLRVESLNSLLTDAGKIYNPDLEHFTTTGDQFGKINFTSETRIWFNLQLNDKRKARERVVQKEKELEETQRELLVLALKRELFLGVLRLKQILKEKSSMQHLDEVIGDFFDRYRKVGFLTPEQRVEVGALDLSRRDLALRRAFNDNEQKLILRMFQRVLNSRCELQIAFKKSGAHKWPSAPSVNIEGSMQEKLDQLALSRSKFEFEREEAKKVPDLKVGLVWQLNRLGRHEYNIFGVAFIMPLPFTDRNQGLRQFSQTNIRKAKLEASWNREQRSLEVDFRKERYSILREHLDRAGDLDKYDALVTEYKNLFGRGLISIPSFLSFKRELMNLMVDVHALEQELASHFFHIHQLAAKTSEHSFISSINL